jgi:hypothetical protein
MTHELTVCPDDSGAWRNITQGDWTTEKAAQGDLVARLRASQLFAVYEQAPGTPLWKHYFQESKDLRADVLLLPTDRLLEQRWQGGAIVIEVKRSGEKIGPGLNQLIDYTNAVFFVEGNIAVVPSYGFLFPICQQAGAVASLMAHQHIGSASIERDVLHLYCGHSRVISIPDAGEVRLGNLNFGRRLGSR